MRSEIYFSFQTVFLCDHITRVTNMIHVSNKIAEVAFHFLVLKIQNT